MKSHNVEIEVYLTHNNWEKDRILIVVMMMMMIMVRLLVNDEDEIG